MTDADRKAANEFIAQYMERKQAQGEWFPSLVGVMRIAYAAGLNAERERHAELVQAARFWRDCERDDEDQAAERILSALKNLSEV